MTTLETFDCPNCGQLAVSAAERCPDALTQERTPGAMHVRAHTHPPAFVRGCAACLYADQQRAGIA